MEAGNVGCEPLHHAARRHVVGRIDGGGEAGGVGAAMALHDNAVQAEKNAAVQLARVHLLLQRAKGALRQYGAEPREKRSPHGSAKIFADLLSGSLGGLQGDVAGEAVGHHHVGGARSEEHTSELQSRQYLVCRLLLEKKKKNRDMLENTSKQQVAKD